jgi:DNA polymerase-1
VRILGMSHGINLNGVRYYDTMIAAQLIDENFSKRLKDLAWLHTFFGGYDTPLEKYRKEHKIKEDYSKIPLEVLYPYAALDAVATWIIYQKQVPVMDAEKLRPLFDKIAMPVRRVMSDAEFNGMRVDTVRAEELRELTKSAIVKLEDKIYSVAGSAFNIASSKQLQHVLYDVIRLPRGKATKTGFSVDAPTLQILVNHPRGEIVKHLLDRSYLNTMVSTHIGQALQFVWPEDGRVHTYYNTTGAVTGRSSASAPSLQNVPHDRLVRSLYTASLGNTLIEADLKSAEMATIAGISGEETFLKSFAEGLDIHAQTYRRIFGLPDDYQCTALERRMAKTINFGLIYGLTPVGLAARLDMTVEEATDFMNLYFKRLPKVAAWMGTQKKLVCRQGYVTSVFGRKRRLLMGLSDNRSDVSRAQRQAMNAPIQSGAADYTYVGLIRLRKLFIKERIQSKIVHTVHDCVLVDAVENERDTCIELIRAAFEQPVKAMPIRMKVDVNVHFRWGGTHESRMCDIFDTVGVKLPSEWEEAC